jgi:hypothetical protein
LNVLFHIATGASIIAASSRFNNETKKDFVLITGASFVLGLISHGILDYTPHCYPINSKIDAITSLLIISLSLWFTKRKWKLTVAFTFLGCLLPDIIDLAPEIINSQLSTSLPTFENVFPWHKQEYSGSIYSHNCEVSKFNHILTLIFCGIIVAMNKMNLKRIIK